MEMGVEMGVDMGMDMGVDLNMVNGGGIGDFGGG